MFAVVDICPKKKEDTPQSFEEVQTDSAWRHYDDQLHWGGAKYGTVL